MMRRALRAAEACSTVAGVMVAVPGFIEPRRGLVKDAPTLGWTDVELRPLVHDLEPGKRWLGFDSMSNLASLAESRALGPQAVPYSLVHIEFGVSVGSALVLHGRGERGANGALGALGHVSVDPDGPSCHCGQRGCVETLVGLKALRERAAPDLVGSWGADPVLLVEEVARRAERCDTAALRGLERTAKDVSRIVAMAVSILDREVVMLGGYVKPLEEWLMPTLRSHLQSDFPSTRALRFRVEVSPLGSGGRHCWRESLVVRDRTFDSPAEVPEGH